MSILSIIVDFVNISNFRILKNYENGTFLVTKDLVLSFVINKKVYHVNVVQNEDHLELGGVAIRIKTILDMIVHFKTVPLYNNVTLYRAPPNENTAAQNGHNGHENDCHACENCSFFIIGDDLNLENILRDEMEISFRRGVQLIHLPPEGKTKYLALTTSETCVTFAYESHEEAQLDKMLGKLVSPIYGSIISTQVDLDMRNWRG